MKLLTKQEFVDIWDKKHKEDLYDKHKRLVHSIAHKQHKKCGTDYDELISEGNLIFCESFKTFKSDKGSFITHLRDDLHWKLGIFSKKYNMINNKTL